jgi:type II secretory pathway predicted ATPase ExeA/transposase InsO family protein
LYHRHGITVAGRTVRGQLRRAGLHRAALAAEPKAYGRHEAARPSERWITDVLAGPWVPWPRREGPARARLFLIVDDHSRLLVDGRFFAHENARACQDLLRRAITRRGVPDVLYADNGAPFSNAWLARTCGVLGIRLVHSRPYSPEGRGKQERLNRYIREAFLAEAIHHGIESLDALNDLFAAWAGQVANRRTHAETGQTPIGRFEAAGPPRQASPDRLREAFRWPVTRRVTRTATVPLEGNAYAVDPALTGRRVELRYDPRPHRGIPGRQARRGRDPVHHPPARAPRRPAGRPPAGCPDRDRLPGPGRRRARGGRRHRSQDRLHRPGPAHRRRTRPGPGTGTGGTAVSAAPWAAHFGLSRTPFGKSIPARDLFARQAHAEAIARISFCVVESALGVVTGDVGAGKTVALRAAVAGLDPTRHQVIYISNPAFGTRGLYVTIVRALGAQPRYLKAELMAQASDLLAAETAERHRRVVVICDESHLLQPDQLEELRLLTNSEMDSASPFAAILAGQPTLNRQLRMGMFAALDQRIATRFTIKPMDLAESAAYLRHHLKLAGRDEPLLADDAIARLHRVSNGLPRALNNAAVAALIAAAAAGKDLVDDACAKKAVAELTRD